MATFDPQLLLVRHGETEWSASGQHTGLTDLPLTAHGEEQARGVGRLLADRAEQGQHFELVLTSPLRRARTTAELAGYPEAVVDPDLLEWDYGPVEGRTTASVSEEVGYDWELFRDGVHVVPPEHAGVPNPSPGETLADVVARVRRVIGVAQPVLDQGHSVLAFAHGHVLRVLGAVWLGLPAETGAILELSTASTSCLGFAKQWRSLEAWNLPSPTQ